MKKLTLAISVVTLVTTCVTAYASYFDDNNTPTVTGPYIGAQLGRTALNYGSSYKLPTNSVDNNKYGVRIYGGYSFSEFLAAELGYDYYGSPNFKHKPTGNEQEFTQQGMDLAGKLSLPLNYGLGVYLKLGAAWVHRGNLNGNAGFFADKPANNKIVFLGGLGVSYSFNPQWAADLSWTRTNENGDLPNIDFYALGLTYRFNNLSDF